MAAHPYLCNVLKSWCIWRSDWNQLIIWQMEISPWHDWGVSRWKKINVGQYDSANAQFGLHRDIHRHYLVDTLLFSIVTCWFSSKVKRGLNAQWVTIGYVEDHKSGKSRLCPKNRGTRPQLVGQSCLALTPSHLRLSAYRLRLASLIIGLTDMNNYISCWRMILGIHLFNMQYLLAMRSCYVVLC